MRASEVDKQPPDAQKSLIPFSAANLRAFSCIKSQLMGTLFSRMRVTHRANGLSITSKGDFLKDFAAEFRFLENSAKIFSLSLAIVETVVRGRLKCFAASTCFFPVAKKLTISTFCRNSSLTLILKPLAGVDKTVGILVLVKVAYIGLMRKQVEMIRTFFYFLS